MVGSFGSEIEMATGAAFTMCLTDNVFISTLSPKIKQPRCSSMQTRLHEKKINATVNFKKNNKNRYHAVSN
jgi:hypothetical protein